MGLCSNQKPEASLAGPGFSLRAVALGQTTRGSWHVLNAKPCSLRHPLLPMWTLLASPTFWSSSPFTPVGSMCWTQPVLMQEGTSLNPNDSSPAHPNTAPLPSLGKVGPQKAAPWKKWKKTRINGKTSCVPGGKLTIVKMTFLSKVIYRFNAILTQNTTTLFEEVKIPILGFMWNYREPRIVKTILEKNKMGGLNTCQFQNVLQRYSKRASWNWH